MSEPTTIRLRPEEEDRERLEAVVADRNSPQKHVRRARIILLLADGLGPRAVQRRTGKSQPTIRRWRERFLAEGVAGLGRDKTRPPGTAPLPRATVERVVAMTLRGAPGEATHWSARRLATRPYTPRTNGKAERFIQTALREWLYARAYASSNHRTADMNSWLHCYNHHRPHAGILAATPVTRLNNVLGNDN